MIAEAEGQVTARVTGDVEHVGALEAAFVPVRRANEKKQRIVLSHLYALDLDIATRAPEQELNRRLAAQRLFDEPRDEALVADQEVELIGVDEQCPHRVADEIGRRLVTGDEVPISFHIGAGNFTGENFWTPERIEHDGSGATNGVFTTGLFLENGKQVFDLLFSGILPRYPDLKFISVESGIGFMPFLLEAVDHTFNYGNVRKTRPEFKMMPSEYFARQVYGCYFFEEFGPTNVLGKIPADNVLFETDYPHPVCLFGNVREKIDAGLRDAKPEVRSKILFDNAARLYNVERPNREPTLAAK